MADFVTRRREAGLNRFQLKVGNDPAEDVARMRATVEAGADDTIIIADANGGWNLLDARRALNGVAYDLERLGLFEWLRWFRK